MQIKKHDFIEIEFTGKLEDGTIFDSNIKEDIEKSELKVKAEPFIFCIGEGMFLKGVDNFLEGKDVGEYKIELNPEDAFGNRDSKLISMAPKKIFDAQKISPFPGLVLNFDGKMGKILSVSGGRIMVDFNHVLAGKKIEYNIKIVKKIENLEEKAKALIKFFLKQDVPFEIKDKKLIVKGKEEIGKFLELFKDKFKELLDLEIEEVKEKPKEEKKEQ